MEGSMPRDRRVLAALSRQNGRSLHFPLYRMSSSLAFTLPQADSSAAERGGAYSDIATQSAWCWSCFREYFFVLSAYRNVDFLYVQFFSLNNCILGGGRFLDKSNGGLSLFS